jgi:glycosyltransferase involved in cell wall biosynthesis
MSALISCLCPTYGRAPNHFNLLEECVESFLRQDYSNKELIILNDCRDQKLVCEQPQVRVINIDERLPTLGDKYNAMVELANGELLAPWEDDDISLPWRLSLSANSIKDADYFNPQAHWFLLDDLLKHEQQTGYAHNASLFRLSAFNRVGGYPSISGPQDAMMHGKLCGLRAITNPLPIDNSFYIYRWGVSDVHLSGQHDTESAYRLHGLKKMTPGTFHIKPKWHRNYLQMVNDATQKQYLAQYPNHRRLDPQ